MTLGVIGGLGPMATAYFMELVINMTDAQNDQDHLEMIIFNCPSIPDRTEYILGKTNNSPIVPMVDIGKQLHQLGVDYISIPCITAHYFFHELTKQIDVPIINALDETVLHLKENGIETAGIMATDGTITSRLFQDRLTSMGIDYIIPSHKAQRDTMDIIYNDIKAGRPADLEKFHRIATELRDNGAQVIILGCTELSLIKRDYNIGAGFIDVMEVLAKTSIVRCQRSLKKQYKCLITK